LQGNPSAQELEAGTAGGACSNVPPFLRRVVSRAAADGGQKSVDQERLLLPCLPPPAVRVTVTCKSKKNTHKAIGFSCSLFFLFCSRVLLPDLSRSGLLLWISSPPLLRAALLADGGSVAGHEDWRGSCRGRLLWGGAVAVVVLAGGRRWWSSFAAVMVLARGEEAEFAGATGGRRQTAPRLWALLLLLPPLGEELETTPLWWALLEGDGAAARGVASLCFWRRRRVVWAVMASLAVCGEGRCWMCSGCQEGEGARDGAAVMRRRCCWGEVRRELGLHSVRLLFLQLRGKRSCCGSKATGKWGLSWDGCSVGGWCGCGLGCAAVFWPGKGMVEPIGKWKEIERRLEWCSGCERGRKFSTGGGDSREKNGFRVRYFLYFFLMLSKLPPRLAEIEGYL